MANAAALVCLLITFGLVDGQAIDENILNDIFGTPPPNVPSISTTPRLEDIMVTPTTSPSRFTNENGDECQCVPYYLCDEELNGINSNNDTVTGWGKLDIRLGANHECQESVERCCKNPRDPTPAPLPQPSNVSEEKKRCGYSNPGGLDFKVTGGSGTEAGFGEYPWVVALINAENDSYIGVGVLIHRSVVLTGAYIASKSKSIIARVGEWDTQTVKERLPHQAQSVAEIVIHEDYRPKSLWNEVALLRLENPVRLDEHINTICLPEQDENFETSKNCVANGWGQKIFGQPGRYAVILKRVEVDMVPFVQCNRLLQRTRLGTRFNLHSSFVCAGGEEGKDTCQGDGGAPLACPVGNNRYKLTGLVAWGIGCGQRDVPAVYANVAAFRNWIDSKMLGWGYHISEDPSGKN